MSFEVTLEPSGHVFRADGSVSLLTAGLTAGNYLPYSCRQGGCGTCKGYVKSGQFTYLDAEPEYMTEEERAKGAILLCQARAESDLVVQIEEIEGISGMPPRIVPCRVTEIDRPTPDVAILRVRLPMNEHMRYMAGQYVDFFVGDGARRSFSIAATPTAAGVTELEFHLKHLPGGKFSDHVFNTMKLREILRFEGPLGTFFIRDNDKPMVMCATGSGFAPIQAMVNAAIASGLHERREMHFYWGARTRDGLYALDTAREWAADHPTFHFHPLLSGPGDSTVPEARSGYIQDAVLSDFADLKNHEVYACGSPAMVNALRLATVGQRNLPENAFYSDEFLPASTMAASIPSA